MSKKFKDTDSQKKTIAKRIGIKSVLLHGDNQVTITTFGKGNAAEIAIKTDTQGSNLAQTYEPRNITARTIRTRDKKREIDLQGTAASELLNVVQTFSTENAGEDYLKLKGTLEKEFFGKEFTDNIRIQIIHNILDIQKILGLYINDIIYTINSQQDLPPDTPLEETDIVGLAMNDDKKVTERLQRIIPYMGFFGEVFNVPPRPKKNEQDKIKNQADIDEANKHNTAVLRILGEMRQITAHFKDSYLLFNKNDKLPRKFQKRNDKGNAVTRDDWAVVDQLFKKRIGDINEDFMNKSKMNLCILFDMLNATSYEDQQEIAQEYYAFSILKEGKNLGVNMKQLRKEMLIKYYPSIEDEIHDSYRSKIYTITDYLLFRELHESEELDNMVNTLRETSNEAEKEALYQDFAKAAWEKTQAILLPFYGQFDGTFTKSKFRTDLPDQQLIADIKLKEETELSLIKLLSFLCNFLSGKEINELLSAYIHKFENIQMFFNTLKKIGEKVQFTDRYGLFNEYGNNNAGNIAKQLRHIVSIGKMKPNFGKKKQEDKKKPDDKKKTELCGAKRPLYKAALKLLGAKDENISDEWLEANVLTGDQSKKKDVNPFRNFIAKQVIESDRFQYLVRYAKPKTVRALMNNPLIIRCVLSRVDNLRADHIHESQIDKYYKILPEYNESETRREEKINALTKYLTGFSFSNIESQRKFIINKLSDRNKAIEKLKALTRLYLMVAYVAIKGLVKANAMYYIAFATFDRDFEMFERKLKGDPMFQPKIECDDGKSRDNYFAIIEYFLDKDDKVHFEPDPNKSDAENKKALFKWIDTRAGKWHFTKKWNTLLRQNIAEAKNVQPTGALLSEVRRNAAHLNVLARLEKYVGEFRPPKMTSYFQLYHFVLQRLMCEPERSEGWNLGDLPDKAKQGMVNWDWLKIAYVSLAYNLPRYKNLTIEALFDPDSDSGKELTAKWKQKEEEKEKRRKNNN
jgi:hypothetical protein